MPVQVEDGWVTVGMGTLSWRSPATLARTLRSYARETMMDVFDEALIFFQQISDADRGGTGGQATSGRRHPDCRVVR